MRLFFLTTNMKSFDGQLVSFDITLKYGDEWSDHRTLNAALATIFKKFVFQKERGEETDYIHWQIRGTLHKKSTYGNVMSDCVPVVPGHWSITSKDTHLAGNQFNYVMKAQTRLDGPWSDKDKVREPPTVTIQLELYWKQDKYPWQVDAERLIVDYNCRFLHYVWDPHYNSGKSVFSEDIEYRGLAEELPPTCERAEDIIQFVYGMPTAKAYTFDLPAALPKKHMRQFYTGLECLKNGYLYDKRYEGKKRRISRPTLMIFANTLPIFNLMAPDRWKVWYVTPSKELVEYNCQDHPIQGYPGYEL